MLWVKFDSLLGKIWPLNRRTVSGADILKIGIAYFETIGLFDYTLSFGRQTVATDDYCLAKVKDNVHMAYFF